MSVKLYYDDRYMKTFTATVQSCREDKKGWAVVLDRTAFYPEGGGQPHDTGLMHCGPLTVIVTDVREKGEEIVHYCDGPVPVGSRVTGEIDWERRFDFMQQHTGEHMFSGVVHSMFGYNNVGFHMNENDVVVDFDGPLTKNDIKAVMDECNRCVWENQPVIAGFPDNVKDMEYRSKKELSGPIRIVTAGQADVCACCGTHTATTARAGPIAALSFAAYKGGTRINILCGKRAVEYLKNRNDDCYEISHILSSPVEKITDSLRSRLKETEMLKAQLARANRQLMEMLARQAVAENGLCVVKKDGLDAASARQLATLLAEKSRTAVAFSGEENGKICIISTEYDTNALGRHIAGALGGKGGGKPGMYQGFVTRRTDEEKIKALVRSFNG